MCSKPWGFHCFCPFSGICKSYNPGQANEVRVLQSCDLTLMAGQVTSLVAPSGSGKSTLLHIAGLLDTADSGQLQIAGRDMSRADDRLRTRSVLPANGRWSFWIKRVWQSVPITDRVNCPAGSNKGSPFAVHWPMNQNFCWPMSRLGTSTLKPLITCLMS